jgi:hypothetical protein
VTYAAGTVNLIIVIEVSAVNLVMNVDLWAYYYLMLALAVCAVNLVADFVPMLEWWYSLLVDYGAQDE